MLITYMTRLVPFAAFAIGGKLKPKYASVADRDRPGQQTPDDRNFKEPPRLSISSESDGKTLAENFRRS